MIPAQYYQGIYLLIVTLFTFFSVSVYNHKIISFPSGWYGHTKVIVFTIFMIVFIGLRPISDVFADMPGYAYAMIDGRFEGLDITWYSNFVFQPMMAFLSSHGASEQTPIIIMAIINFGATFFAMKKMFPNDLMLSMLVFFGAFSTFAYATNGLKAGCAMALFLLALAYRENKLLCLLFLILTLGFHHSMQLPIVSFIICLLCKNTKFFLAFWLICLVLALFHVTYFMSFFGDWTDDHAAEYLNTIAGSRDSVFKGTGFRLDFVLYSFVPITFGWYLLLRKQELSKEYTFLLNIYLLTNAIWMLCMYAEYNNRIAYLSWGLYPVVFLAPLIHDNLFKGNIRWIVYGHLGFTLFMYLIFYAE